MMMVMVIGIAASACCSLVSSGGLGYLYSTGGMCESLEVGCEYTTLGNTTTNDSNVTTDCFGWTTTQCTGKKGKARDTCIKTNKAACKLKNPTATWVTVTPGNTGTTKPPPGKFSLDTSFIKIKECKWPDSANALTGSKYSAGGYVSKKTATECGKLCHTDSKCKAFAVATNADKTGVGCWMKSGLVGSCTEQTGTKTYVRKGYSVTSPDVQPSGVAAPLRTCILSHQGGWQNTCTCSKGGDGITDAKVYKSSKWNQRIPQTQADCEQQDDTAMGVYR